MDIKCNICGSQEWGDFAGRKSIRCGCCGSLERTRLQYLHMQRLGLPKAGSRILHVAPERSIAEICSTTFGADYRPVDFNPDGYKAVRATQFDMCKDSANLQSNSFDLIMHNHVLEHVLCDVTSVMMHMHRALSADGIHIFSVPFWSNKAYDEYLGQLTDEEALKRFGQCDHCRTFSLENLDQTFGLSFGVDFRTFIPKRQFEEGTLRSINFPKVLWNKLDGSTIIVLRKSIACLCDFKRPGLVSSQI